MGTKRIAQIPLCWARSENSIQTHAPKWLEVGQCPLKLCPARPSCAQCANVPSWYMVEIFWIIRHHVGQLYLLPETCCNAFVLRYKQRTDPDHEIWADRKLQVAYCSPPPPPPHKSGELLSQRVLVHRAHTASAPWQLSVVKHRCPIPRCTHPNSP